MARFRSRFFFGLPFKAVGLQCCCSGCVQNHQDLGKKVLLQMMTHLSCPTVLQARSRKSQKMPLPSDVSIYIYLYTVLYIHVYMYVIDILIVPSKKEPCNNLSVFMCESFFFSNAGMFYTFLLPYLLGPFSHFLSPLSGLVMQKAKRYFYSCLGLLLDRCGCIQPYPK